jgi:hypothetical protein
MSQPGQVRGRTLGLLAPRLLTKTDGAAEKRLRLVVLPSLPLDNPSQLGKSIPGSGMVWSESSFSHPQEFLGGG